MTMMMKFVHVLNVEVVYIGTEIFGNVQIVNIQKKIKKQKKRDDIKTITLFGAQDGIRTRSPLKQTHFELLDTLFR